MLSEIGMMHKNLATLTLATLVSLVTCGVASAADPVLHVATTPIDLGAQVLYAKDQGYFKKVGLDVDIQILNSGAAIAAAVAAGSLDIAQANLVSVATAHEKGLPFVVVAPAGLYSADAPTTSMIVAKNSTIKTGKDLNGKTVAVNGLRNISEIGGSAWIEQTGGDVSTIKFIEMPFPQMQAALESGRIDAAVIAEPEASGAVADGSKVIGAPYTAIARQFLIGGWFATNSWAKEHADIVKRFVSATIEAGVWANSHHAESAKILEKYTKITVLPQMKRSIYATKLEASEIQPLLAAAAKFKATKAVVNANDLLLK